MKYFVYDYFTLEEFNDVIEANKYKEELKNNCIIIKGTIMYKTGEQI